MHSRIWCLFHVYCFFLLIFHVLLISFNWLINKQITNGSYQLLFFILVVSLCSFQVISSIKLSQRVNSFLDIFKGIYIELADHIWNSEFDRRASKLREKKKWPKIILCFLLYFSGTTVINFFHYVLSILYLTMYGFLFKPCILRYLNYIYKKIPYDFTIRFLRSEFILYFPCRVKNTFLITLQLEVNLG